MLAVPLTLFAKAPAEAGAFGDSDTVMLCLGAAAAALAATGLRTCCSWRPRGR